MLLLVFTGSIYLRFSICQVFYTEDIIFMCVCVYSQRECVCARTHIYYSTNLVFL